MALDPADHGGTDNEHLPCGADLAELWETGTPPTGHATCQDCQDALLARDALEHTVRTALDEDRTTTTTDTAFLDRVMTAVRAELRPGPLVPLGEDEPDEDDWITSSACAQALRTAVDALPGVRAGRCRITALDTERSRTDIPLPGSRLPRGPLRAVVEVFADLSRPLPRTADLVRAAVAEAAALRVGVRIRRIDVNVRDLLPEEGGT
ncbi:hypothetical protein AB0I39_06585 [Kitasatospora purpeofusca]|uniref:hypothetical protein n=1 Tax=Kitasatospora purpeofusca TaxID=67352 RepID=UPI0033C50EAE